MKHSLTKLPMLPIRRRGRSGFTLIEIMIVVLIIAILAALIIPRLFSNTDKAKIAAAKSDIASLSTALGSYRLDNDNFPNTSDGLDALRVAPSDAPHWKGPYIEKQIGNDPWGNPYQYVSPGPDGQDYLITSYGSDGAPGGDGNAADITSDQQ